MAESQTTECLSVSNLNVRYGGVSAVSNVSMTIAPGEIVAILGPSGAGKTSILAALTGVVASTGSILYGSEDLSLTAPRDRRFANVYQDFRLFEWMTVFDNVSYPCRARGWASDRIAHSVADILARMQLTELSGRRARTLSGGQAQRVSLARALVFEPRALFLDEPFSDLDRPLRHRLVDDVVRDAHVRKLPTLIVTHDGREAVAVADRLAILIDGKIRQCDKPDVVLATPVDDDVTAYLDNSPTAPG